MTKKKTAATAGTTAAKPKAKVYKTTVAQKLFDKHYGTKKREEIVNMFIEKAGLTHNGAGSYYGRMKARADKGV